MLQSVVSDLKLARKLSFMTKSVNRPDASRPILPPGPILWANAIAAPVVSGLDKRCEWLNEWFS
jgi:hypothetical protein